MDFASQSLRRCCRRCRRRRLTPAVFAICIILVCVLLCEARERLLEHLIHALEVLVLAKRFVELSVCFSPEPIRFLCLLERHFRPAPVSDLLEMRHRALIILVLVCVVEAIDAPVGYLNSLRELASGFQNEALAVEGPRIVRTLFERPVVVQVGTLEVAHVEVTSAHIVAKLRFKKFKVLEPKRVFIDIFLFGILEVALHGQFAPHQGEVLIASHEALLVCLDRGHVVTILEQSFSLFLERLRLALKSSDLLLLRLC